MKLGMDAEDYLWRVDLPESFEREKRVVLHAKGLAEKVQKYRESAESGLMAVGKAPMEFGLTLQHICMMRPNAVNCTSY